MEKAVPPASASMPTEEIAAEMPMISGALMPACVAVAAIRCDISAILLSVVAKLLPSATITAPIFPYLLVSSRVTLAYCASIVAASSAVMFVALPSSSTVSVKLAMSVTRMPSCPAISAMAAISVVE